MEIPHNGASGFPNNFQLLCECFWKKSVNCSIYSSFERRSVYQLYHLRYSGKRDNISYLSWVYHSESQFRCAHHSDWSWGWRSFCSKCWKCSSSLLYIQTRSSFARLVFSRSTTLPDTQSLSIFRSEFEIPKLESRYLFFSSWTTSISAASSVWMCTPPKLSKSLHVFARSFPLFLSSSRKRRKKSQTW